MGKRKRNNNELDKNTIQYIKRLRLLQVVVLILLCASFLLFSYGVVNNSKESLRAVALQEVQESMKETINNLSVHIDEVRTRINGEAEVLITDMARRMIETEADGVEDIVAHIRTCKENRLGLKLRVLYQNDDGKLYHIRTLDKVPIPITVADGTPLYENAVHKSFELNGHPCILFILEDDIDVLVKEEIHEYIHLQSYGGNQYIWVNEVLNMEGGDHYAIRRIHPNLVESEGEYLSTSMQDIMGNFPYLTELEGIKQDGEIFHSYYFKNKMNNEITEKFSYSQYYEPFGWIISTGETLEDVYEYSLNVNQQNVKQIVTLMIIFILVFVVIFGVVINILSGQAKMFRSNIMKQNEVLEDIYSTMSVGLLRVRMTDTKSTIIKINPMGLKLIGMETEEELEERKYKHVLSNMLEEDAERLTVACDSLKEQWESAVVDCHVTWKDGSVHLLRVRNMLVEYDGEAKIIQRMYQDITEERRKHEEELQQAEEKATLDPMTQIKNKRAIEQITRDRIREAADKKIPIAVGFVDIDNFRDYNTRYGHLQGDEVIKYVANVLKDSVKGDVGRTGGDEFTFGILNPSFEEVEKAMQVMHKKLNIGVRILDGEEVIPTPCSIGVVIDKDENLEYDTIMKASDEAMYQAKAKGKNTYHILVKKSN